MGKNKRKAEALEDVLARVWCYYCERDFDDLKILMDHQKAKHFRCNSCNRRLNTIGGLAVHKSQVHKEKIDTIENALEFRRDVDIEIFGMTGIPDEVMQAHQRQLTEAYFRKEAERRAATGNPPKGGGAENANKKQKVAETPEQIKARLAEHKARRAAEKAALAAGGSGDSTPLQAAPTPGNAASDTPHAQAHQLHTAADNSSAPVYRPDADLPPHGASYYQGVPTHGMPLVSQTWSPGPATFGTTGPPPPSPYGFSGPINYASDPYQQQSASPAPFMPPSGSPAAGPGMNTNLPSHPIGLPPQPFVPPPGPPASGSAMNTALPPPPTGLPQRPSFNPPYLSKEDMVKIHDGERVPPGAPTVPKSVRQLGPDRRDPRNSTLPLPVRTADDAYQRSTDGTQDMIDNILNQHGYADAIQANGAHTNATQVKIKQEPLDKATEPGNIAAGTELEIKREIKPEPTKDGRMYDPLPTSPPRRRRSSNHSLNNVVGRPFNGNPLAPADAPRGPSASRRGSSASQPGSRPGSRRGSNPGPPGAPKAPKAENPWDKDMERRKKAAAKNQGKSALDSRLTYSDPVVGSEAKLSGLSRYEYGRPETAYRG